MESAEPGRQMTLLKAGSTGGRPHPLIADRAVQALF